MVSFLLPSCTCTHRKLRIGQGLRAIFWRRSRHPVGSDGGFSATSRFIEAGGPEDVYLEKPETLIESNLRDAEATVFLEGARTSMCRDVA